MKNENAIMDRIKARIAYHANEHRHTYENRLFFFNVLRGNIKANFQTYQFTENDIGRSVFLTLEEAEKAVA